MGVGGRAGRAGELTLNPRMIEELEAWRTARLTHQPCAAHHSLEGISHQATDIACRLHVGYHGLIACASPAIVGVKLLL